MLLNTAVKTIKRLSHRGDQAITSDQITTDIVACIMDARRDIIKDLPKEWLKKPATTPITTQVALRPAVYPLASDVQDTIKFWYVEGTAVYKLKRCLSDQEWFDAIYNYASSNNRPYWFRHIGLDANGLKQIELFPIESVSRTINYEYYKTVSTDMTVADINTEIPDVPTQNQDALWKGGLYYFLKQFDDPAQTVALSDYEKSLLGVNKSDQDGQDTTLAFTWGIQRSEPVGNNGVRIN